MPTYIQTDLYGVIDYEQAVGERLDDIGETVGMQRLENEDDEAYIERLEGAVTGYLLEHPEDLNQEFEDQVRQNTEEEANDQAAFEAGMVDRARIIQERNTRRWAEDLLDREANNRQRDERDRDADAAGGGLVPPNLNLDFVAPFVPEDAPDGIETAEDRDAREERNRRGEAANEEARREAEQQRQEREQEQRDRENAARANNNRRRQERENADRDEQQRQEHARRAGGGGGGAAGDPRHAPIIPTGKVVQGFNSNSALRELLGHFTFNNGRFEITGVDMSTVFSNTGFDWSLIPVAEHPVVLAFAIRCGFSGPVGLGKDVELPAKTGQGPSKKKVREFLGNKLNANNWKYLVDLICTAIFAIATARSEGYDLAGAQVPRDATFLNALKDGTYYMENEKWWPNGDDKYKKPK